MGSSPIELASQQLHQLPGPWKVWAKKGERHQLCCQHALPDGGICP